MAKVVYRPLEDDLGRRPLPKEQLRDANGKRFVIHVVDADSPNFESDLTHAFRLNVKKARQTNNKPVPAKRAVKKKR